MIDLVEPFQLVYADCCQPTAQPTSHHRASTEANVLMRRLQQGDLSAFDLLVDRYKHSVANYAARTLGDASEAQDITQNVFIRVFKAADRFRFSSNASTWIFTIARNLCLNELRRRARHRATSADDAGLAQHHRPYAMSLTPSLTATPRDAAVTAELFQKIEEALSHLPERQRSAILLIREGDLSYQEIALILRTSVPATKKLIHCGRKELKRRLRPYLRTGFWEMPEQARFKGSAPAKAFQSMRSR